MDPLENNDYLLQLKSKSEFANTNIFMACKNAVEELL